MDKEELLRRSRLENKKGDERELDLLQKSTKAGMLAGLIFCLVIMVVKMFLGQPYQDVYSLYAVMMAVQNLYRWHSQKEKIFLLVGLGWGAVGSFLFVVYLWQIL